MPEETELFYVFISVNKMFLAGNLNQIIVNLVGLVLLMRTAEERGECPRICGLKMHRSPLQRIPIFCKFLPELSSSTLARAEAIPAFHFPVSLIMDPLGTCTSVGLQVARKWLFLRFCGKKDTFLQ